MAHRGASRAEAENTVAAFRRAGEMGADAVELDVRRTADGVLVVHHDLQTIPEYFDFLLMLNMRVVAAGPTSEVFNEENLRKTYGGRLTMLDAVGHKLGRTSP